MIHDNGKNKLMELAYSLGYEYEKNYRGCAQCTVAAVQDALDIKSDILFKAASGLATGGGLLCDGVCGGYSGGIMIMSSFFGRKRENIDDDHDEKYCSFRMATYLHKKFINKYGSVICKDIHNKIFGRTYDLWNPEEKEAFNNAGAHETKCTEVVATASSWIVQLIFEEISLRGIRFEDLFIPE
ncbi:MAG: C_GCAxxG_C_C family protein [Spirochaetales bacterium]|nr:C_GCAxxG_C_C family protein [Spirochaetales bacterium]